MNEVGKTFRKLICNYENAHTSVRRHRFNFFLLFSKRAETRSTHRKGCCMWFENYMFLYQRGLRGKNFLEMEKFCMEILKHTNDFMFLITFFCENHKNVLRALFSLPGKLWCDDKGTDAMMFVRHFEYGSKKVAYLLFNMFVVINFNPAAVNSLDSWMYAGERHIGVNSMINIYERDFEGLPSL